MTLSLQGNLLRKHGKGLEKVMRASSALRSQALVSGCVCVYVCVHLHGQKGQLGVMGRRRVS